MKLAETMAKNFAYAVDMWIGITIRQTQLESHGPLSFRDWLDRSSNRVLIGGGRK